MEKTFFRLFEILLIDPTVLYFKIHPESAEHCRSHKAFCQTLMYQLVQPLLDAYASAEVHVSSIFFFYESNYNLLMFCLHFWHENNCPVVRMLNYYHYFFHF